MTKFGKRTIVFILIAAVVLVGAGAWYHYIRTNSKDIPSLYYRSTSTSVPTTAVLGTRTWSKRVWDGSFEGESADCPNPIEQMKDSTEFLVVPSQTAHSPLEQRIEIYVGYPSNGTKSIYNTPPKIKSISVNLYVDERSVQTVATAWGDSVDTFSFVAPEEKGEYIYAAWVEYEQGTVSYSMKIVVDDLKAIVE